MKTPLEKLTSILCECETVKKDIMELRFGCELESKITKRHANLIHKEDGDLQICRFNGQIQNGNIKGFYNIIGNEIQDHHLRMYVNAGKIKDIMTLKIEDDGCVIVEYFIKINKCDNEVRETTICKLEPKPLYKQNDKILKKIIEFLEKNK